MKNIQNKVENIFYKLFPRFDIGKEFDFFLENLYSLLSSGISVLEAFDSLQSEIKSKRFKRIVLEINKDVASGVSVSTALMNSGLFSRHIFVLLAMGERSGRLVENLKIISEEGKKSRGLSSKIRSALMYPVFVIGLTLVVGIGISWFILPKLATVFTQLKVKLPFLTQMLINFGSFMNQYGLYAILFLLIFIFVLFYFVFYFKKTKHIGESILFVLPGVSTLLKQVEISRFSYLLGTLLSAGVSPNEALYSISEATSWKRYKDFYLFLSESVAEGNSFKTSFDSYPKYSNLFPSSIRHLVMAGERSGTISSTLINISKNYEEKTDTTAKDLATILEPVLLVFVWLGVVMVALSVILPIYSLVGDFNR